MPRTCLAFGLCLAVFGGRPSAAPAQDAKPAEQLYGVTYDVSGLLKKGPRPEATTEALIGLIINLGMYWERYLIIPVMLTINRMPFTWKLYQPRIEIFLTIGTFSLFLLFYMAASRLIPLIPVWEVQEGQMTHSMRKVGKTQVPTISEFE